MLSGDLFFYSQFVIPGILWHNKPQVVMSVPSDPAAIYMRTKTLWIKEDYLHEILGGRKTVEVRVAYDNIARLCPGDRLLLNDRHPFRIRRAAHYADFEELMAHEDAAAIAPGWDAAALLQALRSLYPADKEALGVVALEIEPEG